MSQHIAIIQGHPDPAGHHYGHALMAAYQKGAEAAGKEVKVITVATMEFPLLRSEKEWTEGKPPPAIEEAQDVIQWADHLVLIYPLWMGTMPALLKAFLEQTLRPGFAVSINAEHTGGKTRLTDKSARVVVTMGMPSLIYRWFFRAHSLKSLERNVLRFVGIKPVKETLIGPGP